MGPNKQQYNVKRATKDRARPGLVACTTSGQETEWVYSYNPGARTGRINA